jgi:hypothetical protein
MPEGLIDSIRGLLRRKLPQKGKGTESAEARAAEYFKKLEEKKCQVGLILAGHRGLDFGGLAEPIDGIVRAFGPDAKFGRHGEKFTHRFTAQQLGLVENEWDDVSLDITQSQRGQHNIREVSMVFQLQATSQIRIDCHERLESRMKQLEAALREAGTSFSESPYGYGTPGVQGLDLYLPNSRSPAHIAAGSNEFQLVSDISEEDNWHSSPTATLEWVEANLNVIKTLTQIMSSNDTKSS